MMEAVILDFTARKLDRELGVSEKGAADGKRNLPRSDANALSATEAAVVDRVEAALAQQSQGFVGSGSASDFNTLPEDLEALASEPQTILTQFRGRKARAQSATQIELQSAYTDFERAQRGYRSFRISHGLTEREPRYDMVFWRKAFWLVLMFCIEVAANGWVIGQASPGGLVQGWTTALLISVLVVLTGTLIGMGPWRYLRYNGPNGTGRAHLLWAAPAFALGSCALVLFAFYVAHYRYLLAQTSLDAPVPTNILTSIRTQPFAPFEQIESLILFVVALLIGVFAVARGAYWDDPYPGYGPLHRQMMVERERTEELALRLSAEVDRAKDDADSAMGEVTGKTQKFVGGLRDALSRAENGGEGWDRANLEIIAEGRAALDLYREANRDNRTTSEPGYFSDDPFRSLTPPSGASVIASLDSALARSTQKITQCKSQLAGARAQLEAEYQSFYEDEISPFLKSMSGEAAKRVRDEFAGSGVSVAKSEGASANIEAVDVEDSEEAEEEQPVVRIRRGRRRF
jgi:hypothetical protein